MRTRRAALLAATALALAGCAGGTGAESADPPDSGPDFTLTTIAERADFQWVIPKGTAEKVNVGTHDPIFPSVMYAKVGQTIRIVNEDRIGYTVGPFYVGPYQTMEQVLRRPGTFEGVCSTHYGARFLLIVE